MVPESAPRSAIRAEIQGLRAIAVLLVVLFHFWPGRIPGGYIGVDVFFVVSGFLITDHLLREVSATGRLSLPSFWARRARRLLPAALLVLTSVAVASFLIVPRGLWQRYFSEIGASALYVENWLLAGSAVDYLAANNSPSPVEHFWSLSVEEQFYLVWPILVVAALILTRRSGIRTRRLTILAVLGTVTIASFITSLVLTAEYPAAAYFVTPARAWEFGAGALLAFAPAAVAGSRLAFLAAWGGVLAIAGAAFVLDAQTAFPGIAAILPTAGAIAVIWGGTSTGAWSVTSLSRWRPIQYVGDISYSLYLWHWPSVILVPFVTLQPMSNEMKILALVVTFVLAGLTRVFVEDPVRRARLLTRNKPRWSLLGALTAMVLVSVLCVGGIISGLALTNPSPPPSPEGSRCFGAAATISGNKCPEVILSDWAAASAFARTDKKDLGQGEGSKICETQAWTSDVYVCRIGNYRDPAKTVALIGDSHANQYDGALAAISRDLHWNVLVYVRSACAGLGDSSIYFGPREWDGSACATWGKSVTKLVMSDPTIDTIFVNAYAGAYVTGPDMKPIGPEPFIAMWRPYIATGKKIVVLSDTPRPIENAPDCLEANKAVAPCSALPDTAFRPNVMKDAVLKIASPSVAYVDLSARYCFDGTCPPLIGGVIVYFDDSHLTKTYSTTLGPFIKEALGLSPR